jgi:hypothetical protein
MRFRLRILNIHGNATYQAALNACDAEHRHEMRSTASGCQNLQGQFRRAFQFWSTGLRKLRYQIDHLGRGQEPNSIGAECPDRHGKLLQ